jgi:hypothetical protein
MVARARGETRKSAPTQPLRAKSSTAAEPVESRFGSRCNFHRRPWKARNLAAARPLKTRTRTPLAGTPPIVLLTGPDGMRLPLGAQCVLPCVTFVPLAPVSGACLPPASTGIGGGVKSAQCIMDAGRRIGFERHMRNPWVSARLLAITGSRPPLRTKPSI